MANVHLITTRRLARVARPPIPIRQPIYIYPPAHPRPEYRKRCLHTPPNPPACSGPHPNLWVCGCAGSQGFEGVDGRWMVDMGADYIKEDSCGGTSNHSAAFAQYARMRDVLNATGKHVYFSLCGWHPWYAPPDAAIGYGGGATLGNSWRVRKEGRGEVQWVRVGACTSVCRRWTGQLHIHTGKEWVGGPVIASNPTMCCVSLVSFSDPWRRQKLGRPVWGNAREQAPGTHAHLHRAPPTRSPHPTMWSQAVNTMAQLTAFNKPQGWNDPDLLLGPWCGIDHNQDFCGRLSVAVVAGGGWRW